MKFYFSFGGHFVQPCMRAEPVGQFSRGPNEDHLCHISLNLGCCC